MLKKAVLLVAGLCLLMTIPAWALPRESKSKAKAFKHPAKITAPAFVTGELLIKFRENVTNSDLAEFNQKIGGNATSKQEAQAAFHAYYRTTPTNERFLKWQKISISAAQGTQAVLAEVKANPLVESAEVNGYMCADALSTTYTPNGAFNDPYYTDGHSQWWISRTSGDRAKNANPVFVGTTDVVVAVLDTGVWTNHPDLAGRMVAGWNFVANNSNTNDDNEYVDTIWIRGHGTHCAGLIAAVADNSGIAGTAGWKSNIKIMPVKVLGSGATGTFANIGAGITWAADHGADVLSMSFGSDVNSAAVRDALSYAAGQGKVLVCSAGNDNADIAAAPYYPACYPNVICVGATTSDDWITFYSNFGAGVIDLVAPGGSLYDYGGGWYEDNGVTATAMNDGWNAVDGTSFSAPQVAALAALLKLQLPSRTPAQIETLIKDGCDWFEFYDGYYGIPGTPTTWVGMGSEYYGEGKMNVNNSLGFYQTPTPSPTITVTGTISPTPTITPTFTITPTITPTSTASPTSTPLVLPREVFRAFPQPGRDQIRLAYNFIGPGKIAGELYNMAGEKVMNFSDTPIDRQGYALTELKTGDLGPGIYLLKFKVTDQSGTREFKGKIALVR